MTRRMPFSLPLALPLALLAAVLGRPAPAATPSGTLRGGGRIDDLPVAVPSATARRIPASCDGHRGARFDADEIERNPFWCPDPDTAALWADYLDGLRKAHDSVGAIVEVRASGVPAGLGAPIYGKLDSDLAAAMMTINAVKGVEIGEGMAAVSGGGRRPPRISTTHCS